MRASSSAGVPAASPPLRLLAWAFLAAALALSLSVDYADSVGLFGLTLLGIFWGFRDGFVRGCGRGERLLLAVFALVPAAALLSDELGRFTRQEFRFAGRDLRFLLVVAAYGALRRLRPNARGLSLVLAGGAVLALVIGLFEHFGMGAARASGATGVAIVFGDLAVLSGVAGATGLLLGGRRPGKGIQALAVLALAAGLGAAVLSDSRGSWLGFIVLAAVFYVALGARGHYGRRFLLVVVAFVCVSGAFLAATGFSRSLSPLRRFEHVGRDLSLEATYLRVPPSLRRRWAFTRCLASPRALAFYQKAVRILPPQKGDRGWILVVPPRGLPAICRRAGGATFVLAVPWSRDVTTFVFPTALLDAGPMTLAFWARGRFRVRTCNTCRWHDLASTRFRRFLVRGRVLRSSSLFVTLRPGRQVWFVPAQLRSGEYSAAPLRNSVDERFEMWHAALLMARRHPWWGVGFGGFDDAAHRLVRAGFTPPFVAAYEHPHNDLLDALASGGVVGLAVQLLLYLIPLLIFVPAVRDPDPERRALGWIGVLGVTGFVVFGTTEAMFVHSLVIGWYALYVGAVAAALSPSVVHRPPGRELLQSRSD